MPRGPRPQPSAVKKARGNPGHRALPQDEPAAPTADAVADAPELLSDEAKVCWTKVHKILDDADVLTVMDTPALLLYCEAFARWDKARREMRKPGTGMVINVETMYGRTKKVSPWMKVLDRAHDQMLKIMLEYGMTPAARTRVRTASGMAGGQKQKKKNNVFSLIKDSGKAAA